MILACLSLLAPQPVYADTSQRSLRCGGSLFTVTNTYAPDAFVVWQTIDVRRKDGRVFHVDLRNLRKGRATGIFGFVSSWLCHRYRHREFVELLYGCDSYMTDADVDRYCRGENTAEWVRYIGLSGEPLDPGYVIEDPRYDALERRLGIKDGRTMMQAD